MEDFKYYNLREFILDLTELLNEVEDLREENAILKKQVADYNDFIMTLNKIREIGSLLLKLLRN